MIEQKRKLKQKQIAEVAKLSELHLFVTVDEFEKVLSDIKDEGLSAKKTYVKRFQHF